MPDTETPWMDYAAWKFQQDWMEKAERAALGQFHCGYSKEELQQLEQGTHYTQTNNHDTTTIES